jgi:hypothetical protein
MTEATSEWEEIHGFESPGEFERFVAFMERQVAGGSAAEVATDPRYDRGKILGGRWFQNTETGEVWRLVPPDPPFRGLWEPVRR